MAENEELENFLMMVKEESEKVGLKLSFHKTKIVASSPITSWQIDGKTVEIETLLFWVPKSLEIKRRSIEIKRRLLLGRKL